MTSYLFPFISLEALLVECYCKLKLFSVVHDRHHSINFYGDILSGCTDSTEYNICAMDLFCKQYNLHNLQ